MGKTEKPLPVVTSGRGSKNSLGAVHDWTARRALSFAVVVGVGGGCAGELVSHMLV